MSGIWILPPTSGGGGEGGTGEVKWVDIKNKPTEFNPKEHQHQKEDVIGLEDSLDSKVDKIDGKGLSSNDFTDEDKNKLDKLSETEIDGNLVKSVNSILPDETGDVKISKDDLGLDKVENENYTPLASFEEHANNKAIHVSQDLLDTINKHSQELEETATQKEVDEKLKEIEIDYKEMDEILMARIIKEAELIEGKVDKVEGKGLSTNDFTDADKSKLDNVPAEIKDLVATVSSNTESIESINELTLTHTQNIAELEDKLENLDFPESPVLSVNGKTGNIVITKETIGLSNVLDKEQATKEDLEDFKETNGVALLELAETLESYTDKEVASEADRTNNKLMEKVDKELGKGLSSNDFTTEYKDKLDSIDSSKRYVQTVNGASPDAQGDVEIDKSSVGLSKLENKYYTPLDDFTSYKESTEASLSEKVDRIEGKQLSTNDYTNEDKNKLDNLPTELNTGVMTVNSIAPDDNGNLDLDFVSNDVYREHAENIEIHLTKEEKSLISQIPNKVDAELGKSLTTNDFTNEYKTLIETNENEIKALKELIGDGETPVELPPKFVVYKEGHVYGLGGVVYDIVHNNIVTGNLAPRFIYDNPNFFDDKNFQNNTINVYYDGNSSLVESINKKEGSGYEGKLTNILNKDVAVKHQWFLNGKETREFKIETEFLGNTFNLPIRWGDVFDEKVETASIALSLLHSIQFEDREEFGALSKSLSNAICNNEFTFLNRKEYKIDLEVNLTYKDTTNYKDGIQTYFSIIDNVFYLTEDMKDIQKIKYVDDDAKLVSFYEDDYSVYLRASLRDNKFDSEVSRVFEEEFVYTADRQADRQNPILNNITIDHYLNQKMRLTASTGFGSSELDRTIVANKKSENEVANLKNIVISKDVPAENYEGLIWYQIE